MNEMVVLEMQDLFESEPDQQTRIPNIVVATDGPFWLWGFLFFSAFSIAGYGVFSRR